MNINFRTALKKLACLIASFAVFFIFALFNAEPALAAARLTLDPSAADLTKNSEIEVKLQINTDGASVFGADAVINYPSADLELKSVSNGGFFTDFSNAPSGGMIEIHAFFGASFDSKSGIGDVALIRFVGKKDTGSGLVSFGCTGGGETQILNSNGDNILSCSSLNALTLTYTGAASANDTQTPATGATSAPTAGEPNSCGGTCGSNYNCKAGFFCYLGYCRNPLCSSSTDCVCRATPAPTPRKTPIPKPTIEVVVLASATPYPSSLAQASPETTIIPAETSGTSGFMDLLKKYALWGLIGLAIILLLIFVSKLFRKKGPPDSSGGIRPIAPVNSGGSTTPMQENSSQTQAPYQPPAGNNPPSVGY